MSNAPIFTTSGPERTPTPVSTRIPSERITLAEFLDEGPPSSSGTSTPSRIEQLRQKARRLSWKRKGSEQELDVRGLVQGAHSRDGSWEDLVGFENDKPSPTVEHSPIDHLPQDAPSSEQAFYEGFKFGLLHGLTRPFAQIPYLENAPRAKVEEAPAIDSLEKFLNHPVSRPKIPHALTDPCDLNSYGEGVRNFGKSASSQLREEVRTKIDYLEEETQREDESDARSVVSLTDEGYNNRVNFSDDLPAWADPETDVSRVKIRKLIGKNSMAQQLLVRAQELRSKARSRNSLPVSLATYDIQDLVFNTSSLAFRVEARSDMERKAKLWPNNYLISTLPPHGGEIGVFVQWDLGLVEGAEFCKTVPLPMSIQAKRGLGIIGERLWYERYLLSSSERLVDDLGGSEYEA